MRAGAWRAVLGELHPDFTPWTHSTFAWHPDKAAFAAAYAHAGHAPALEYGEEGAWYRSAHRFNTAPLHTPGWTTTGKLRLEGVPWIRSADVTVHLQGDDIVARDPSGRVLGSLIDNWAIASSTHQLELHGLGPRSPRLVCGRVVVQRRSWLLEISEALRRDVEEIGADALVAFRRVRQELGLPEDVFVRAILPLRLSEHKDTKPMMIDFRSPLLLELLAASVKRYRAVRFTEMLPSSEELFLRDGAGRYSFELRCLTVPARVVREE
jgi:hypothetical protein